MSYRFRERLAIGCLLLVMATWACLAVPTSVFVVHCEPTKATSMMWLELADLVSLADQYAVPLSIDFTGQWAQMILDDPSKIALIEAWLSQGHEIGCHHHGYWGTKDRGSTWDGYTNTPLQQIASEDRHLFRGTMEEYMALLNALPGERRSGCMGSTNTEDAMDYPCQLEYSTAGHAAEDGVTVPETLSPNECSVIQIGHMLIAGQERGALPSLYDQTDDAVIFGVNGHVYNYADFPEQFEAWFAYLASMDVAGQFRGTVSGVLDDWRSKD